MKTAYWMAIIVATLPGVASASGNPLKDLVIAATKFGKAGPVELRGDLRDDFRRKLGVPEANFTVEARATRKHSKQPECKHVQIVFDSTTLVSGQDGVSKPFHLQMGMQICPDGKPPKVLDPVVNPVYPYPDRPLQTTIPTSGQ